MKSYYDDLDGFDLLVETPTPPHHHPKNNKNNDNNILAPPGTSSLLPPVLENEQQHDDSSILPPPSTTGKSKAMSFGLSHRRRSSVAIPSNKMLAAACVSNPSPLKINLSSCSSTTVISCRQQQQQQKASSSPLSILFNNSSNNHNHGRRSSIAAPRLSQAAGRMLSRLSLGLHDALHWLGGQGSLPQPNTEVQVGTEVQGRGGKREASKKRYTTLQQPVGGPSPIAEEEDDEEEEGATTTTATTATTPTHAVTKEPSRKLTLAEHQQPPGSPEFLTPLEQLLNLCGQDTSLYSIPSMEHLLGGHVDLGAVKKIGEGTYGEAYKAGDVVFKIVPMEGSTLVNGEGQKKAEEILAEAAITLTLNGLRSVETMRSPNSSNYRLITNNSDKKQDNNAAGFVETYGVGVCRGRYAQELKKEWHRWDLIHKSDNDPVDIFPPDQLFVVFVVGDGGIDLEHYQPKTFNEIRSILLQTALTLAVAEEACEFEHRDLHWGNVLIKRVGNGTTNKGGNVAKYRLRGVDIEAAMEGAQVTLIDFTLSRLMTPDGEVAYCDLITDPLLFSGPKGDVQAETYRRMRELTGNCWERHVAGTNAAWLHYLADMCLVHKVEGGGVGGGGGVGSGAEKQALKGFRKRVLGYKSAGEAVWDEFFKGAWTAL
jgi:serine/threonine-protein kinase haspin